MSPTAEIAPFTEIRTADGAFVGVCTVAARVSGWLLHFAVSRPMAVTFDADVMLKPVSLETVTVEPALWQDERGRVESILRLTHGTPEQLRHVKHVVAVGATCKVQPNSAHTISRSPSLVSAYEASSEGCDGSETCVCQACCVQRTRDREEARQLKAESSPSPARGAQTPAERCPLCSFDPTSLNDYCDEHRPRFTHAAAPAAPTEDHSLKRERELCNRCGGNGVLPVRNDEGLRIGIQTCPRCGGLCWEDHA